MVGSGCHGGTERGARPPEIGLSLFERPREPHRGLAFRACFASPLFDGFSSLRIHEARNRDTRGGRRGKNFLPRTYAKTFPLEERFWYRDRRVVGFRRSFLRKSFRRPARGMSLENRGGDIHLVIRYRKGERSSARNDGKLLRCRRTFALELEHPWYTLFNNFFYILYIDEGREVLQGT